MQKQGVFIFELTQVPLSNAVAAVTGTEQKRPRAVREGVLKREGVLSSIQTVGRARVTPNLPTYRLVIGSNSLKLQSYSLGMGSNMD